VLVYGFIGWIGKPYDMPIAVLSSLTLGLSIDFAIHFLQRTREAYRSSRDLGQAFRHIFESPSHAITRNILVIAIGFVPMFFANLVPYVTVSAFFFAIMLVSGLTTLFSFPAILSSLNPAFLAMAIQAGLTCAIANPQSPQIMRMARAVPPGPAVSPTGMEMPYLRGIKTSCSQARRPPTPRPASRSRPSFASRSSKRASGHPIVMMGWPARTSSPMPASMLSTLPAHGALTSCLAFIASTAATT